MAFSVMEPGVSLAKQKGSDEPVALLVAVFLPDVAAFAPRQAALSAAMYREKPVTFWDDEDRHLRRIPVAACVYSLYMW